MTEKPQLDPYLAQFGSGMCYSLALFIAHKGNFRYILAELEMLAADGALQFTAEEKADPKKMRRVIEHLAAVRWFSHAVNPIRNLVIPKSIPAALRGRLAMLRDKCQSWALPAQAAQLTPTDIEWATDEAKELLRLLDEHHAVPTIKAHLGEA